jgi:hypothetical protein
VSTSVEHWRERQQEKEELVNEFLAAINKGHAGDVSLEVIEEALAETASLFIAQHFDNPWDEAHAFNESVLENVMQGGLMDGTFAIMRVDKLDEQTN